MPDFDALITSLAAIAFDLAATGELDGFDTLMDACAVLENVKSEK